jgi:hypothetical protein
MLLKSHQEGNALMCVGQRTTFKVAGRIAAAPCHSIISFSSAMYLESMSAGKCKERICVAMHAAIISMLKHALHSYSKNSRTNGF